jgi:hypothetical protein
VRTFQRRKLESAPDFIGQIHHTWIVESDDPDDLVVISFETTLMFTAKFFNEDIPQWGDAFLYEHYPKEHMPEGVELLGGWAHADCPVLEKPCWVDDLFDSAIPAVTLKHTWQRGGFQDEIIYSQLEKSYKEWQ